MLIILNGYLKDNFDNYIDGSVSRFLPELSMSHTTYEEWQVIVADFAYRTAAYSVAGEVFAGALYKFLGSTKYLRFGKHFIGSKGETIGEAFLIQKHVLEWIGVAATGLADAFNNIFDTGIREGTTFTYYVTAEFNESTPFIYEHQIFMVDVHESGEVTWVVHTPW